LDESEAMRWCQKGDVSVQPRTASTPLSAFTYIEPIICDKLTNKQKADLILASFYRDNIPKEAVDLQRAVFAKFGYKLRQIKFSVNDITRGFHGEAIQNFLFSCDKRDCALIFDVDAIPLSRYSIPSLAQNALCGRVCGTAQQSNFLHADHPYASPAFFGITIDTFYKLGGKCAQTQRSDAVEELTWKAQEIGIPVSLFWPHSSETKKWKLGLIQWYGIGTTYASRGFPIAYHQFEARVSTDNFVCKCKEILEM